MYGTSNHYTSRTSSSTCPPARSHPQSHARATAPRPKHHQSGQLNCPATQRKSHPGLVSHSSRHGSSEQCSTPGANTSRAYQAQHVSSQWPSGNNVPTCSPPWPSPGVDTRAHGRSPTSAPSMQSIKVSPIYSTSTHRTVAPSSVSSFVYPSTTYSSASTATSSPNTHAPQFHWSFNSPQKLNRPCRRSLANVSAYPVQNSTSMRRDGYYNPH
ncbi:hypothetical protein C8Q80DRAFT_519933 [Daedaleopsis nitida]|nr:hypothetical protein C8Q80DRAFT_519933 [Daedaleopsis nitida]